MKKVFYFALLGMMMAVLSGCNTNSPSSPNRHEQEPLAYAAVNINDSTHDADILLACSDGSYMICDVNNENGYGVVYLNQSLDNPIEDGILLFLDETGTPVYVYSKGREFYFPFATELMCHMAYQDTKGDISYYFDMLLFETSSFQYAPKRMPTTWMEQATHPFTGWWQEAHQFDWTWDDHQRRAILPFLAKVTSFGLTAVGMVLSPAEWKSGVVIFYEEANKSGYVNDYGIQFLENYEELKTIKEGTEVWERWARKGIGYKYVAGKFGLGLLASLLNQYADDALNNLGKLKGDTQDYFLNPEYRLSLSEYTIQAGNKKEEHTIIVTTASEWEVLDPLCDWCKAEKDEYEPNAVKIYIQANETDEDRVCNVIVRAVSGATYPTTVTVRQSPLKLEVKENYLSFYLKSDAHTVDVQVGAHVRDWAVTYKPDWLNARSSRFSLTLSVNVANYPLEEIADEVILTAYMEDGSTYNCPIHVNIVPTAESTSATWDNTSWIFSGPIQGSDGSGGTIGMQLIVHSVAGHSASLTLMSTPNIPCYITEDAHHKLNGTFSYEGISGNFTISRSGNSATCQIAIFIPDLGTGVGTLTGQLQ